MGTEPQMAWVGVGIRRCSAFTAVGFVAGQQVIRKPIIVQVLRTLISVPGLRTGFGRFFVRFSAKWPSFFSAIWPIMQILQGWIAHNVPFSDTESVPLKIQSYNSSVYTTQSLRPKDNSFLRH